MSTQIQRRRGTTVQHSSFTGAVGETTIDTDKEVVVVHDGVQVGGYPMMRENGSNSALALGSAGTPSLKFTGDTNTGIYSPGADQVAISTNGTGRLFVNASGNVGVGVSSPSARLHVSGGDSVVGSTNLCRILSNGQVVDFTNAAQDTYVAGRINGLNLKFYTNAGSGIDIDSSGRVGIGTSTVSDQLEIANGTTDAANAVGIRSGRYLNAAQEGAQVKFYSDNTSSWLGTREVARIGAFGLASDHRVGSLAFALKTTNSASNPTELMRLTPTGLGIGTTSPGYPLDVNGIVNVVSGSNGRINLGATTNYLYGDSTGNLIAGNSGGDRVQIDASGRLLVGTSSSRTVHGDHTPQIQLEGTTYQGSTLSIINNGNNEFGAYIFLGKARGGSIGSNTIVNNGDSLGQIRFSGSDGVGDFSVGALVEAKVDGTPGSGDLPTRLEFSTTADGASSPTERMRINSVGSIKQQGASSSLESATGDFNEVNIHNTVTTVLLQRATNSSFASSVSVLKAVRAASSSYNFLVADSDSSGSSDTEFKLRGDGQAYADGSWNGGGADYAEYFEWSDGNPDEEDRRGISVVLDSDQIRPAVDGEDPIGVISGNPSVVGDAAWNKWSGKYLRDDYGTYILEDYEVVNDEGENVIQQRRKLNPAYDPDQEYVNREDRPEWDCVGLMGKLRIRKGQPTGSRWIKMRDISDSVEEWLVR
jgi:hypothetical protein